jgi:hemerythrin-like domain-containing protein
MAQPDAIAMLKADHRSLKRLFRAFHEAGGRAHARRRDIVDRIISELSVHSGIEETVFYPHIRGAVASAEDEVLESLEEHHLVKLMLSELETLDPRHERFTAKVTVLTEVVGHHIDEEERELFPRVRRLLSRHELMTIGEELAEARAIVPSRPHPNSPDEPPGNVLAAAVTTPLDAVIRGMRRAASRGSRAVGV